MDILSVTTTVITVCNGIVKYLARLRSSDDVQRLKTQTQLLCNVLENLNEEFHIQIVRQTIQSASDDGAGFEGQYWNSLKESLTHCRETLHKLEDLLKNGSNGVFGRVLSHRLLSPIKLDLQRDEINNCLQEIKFYREAMSIALQFITLSIGQNSRSLISKKLDEILFNINHVLECMNHDGGSRTGLQTLRMSLVKAHQLASDKSLSMIDPDHETKRTDIEAWRDNQPKEYAGTESAPSVPGSALSLQRRPTNSTSPTFPTTRSTSDNDVAILVRNAEVYVNDKQYENASLCLQEAHSRLQDNIVLRFKEWVQVSTLLVFCHCKSDKLHEAEQLVTSMANDIAELQSYGKAHERAQTICDLGNSVIHNLLVKNSLEAAERLAIKIIEMGEQNGILASETERSLAEIYRRQGKFAEALEHCNKTMLPENGAETRPTGEETEREGKILLAFIYFTAGDMKKYVVGEAYLSDHHKGLLRIDILCSKDPDLALREWIGFHEGTPLRDWTVEQNPAIEEQLAHQRLLLLLSFIKFGNVSQVERALKKWNYIDIINNSHQDKETALIAACRENKPDVVDLLCRQGANIEYHGAKGWTALHWASFHGFSGVVEKLLDNGACINVTSDDGHTPLAVVRWAPWDSTKRRGRKEVVRLLRNRAP